MKLIGKILLGLLLTAGAVLGYLSFRKPDSVAPSTVKVEATPERLKRGEYLFTTLSDCDGCHSERDWSKFGAPVLAGRRGVGTVMPPELGLPGRVAPSNITPDVETGLGSWTDGEKIRAIREGVSKDGRALFPMMPYTYYRSMSDEDVYSLVAYMNSLPPVRNAVPRTDLDFPVGLMIKGVPKPSGAVAQPDRGDKLKYGEYLTSIGVCGECHTQAERGELKMDKAFAGGREFQIGRFIVHSANITPDETTGVGTWDEQRFVKRFKDYGNFNLNGSPTANQSNFTLMSWPAMSQLDEDDLKTIYAYLRTLKPIHNPVDSHPAQPNPN
ncbi:MAG: hypothetical protein IT161_21110 [Bryobacterales bacterium]|nr:hypothetical protein [Bryobacterales bacterium]